MSYLDYDGPQFRTIIEALYKNNIEYYISTSEPSETLAVLYDNGGSVVKVKKTNDGHWFNCKYGDDHNQIISCGFRVVDKDYWDLIATFS